MAEARDQSSLQGPLTDETLYEAITRLREDSELYARLFEALESCQSDEDRARVLFKFATDERAIAALLPDAEHHHGGYDTQTTTVTTTVTVATTAVPALENDPHGQNSERE